MSVCPFEAVFVNQSNFSFIHSSICLSIRLYSCLSLYLPGFHVFFVHFFTHMSRLLFCFYVSHVAMRLLLFYGAWSITSHIIYVSVHINFSDYPSAMLSLTIIRLSVRPSVCLVIGCPSVYQSVFIMSNDSGSLECLCGMGCKREFPFHSRSIRQSVSIILFVTPLS